MKHFISLLALLGVLFTASCATGPAPAANAPSQEPIGGAVQHAGSGFRFPLTVGNFTRGAIRHYDATGGNMSVAYGSSSPVPIMITVYVYPAPGLASVGSPATTVAEARERLAQDHFNECTGSILEAHPGAKFAYRKGITTRAAGKTYAGYLAKYTFSDAFAGGPVQELESLLYLYCYVDGKWSVKYRITYPANPEARFPIEGFLHNFTWTINPPI